MPRDDMALLGLTPGRHDPRAITLRFEAERARWVAALHDPRTYATARARLEELHVAYRALLAGQERMGATAPPDPAAELRQAIAMSLEDGLLRHSRRQALLEQGRALGFNEFQVQLLIAQVQFGGPAEPGPARPAVGPVAGPHPRTWARVAAVGVLALAMFLGMMRWVSA
jgi:hypothetical protein